MPKKPQRRRPSDEHELAYVPENQGPENSVVAMAQYSFPIVFTILLTNEVWPAAAVPAGLAIGLLVRWFRRRSATLPHRVIKVEGDQLLIMDSNRRLLVEECLDALDKVSLDTRTIQKVQENASTGIIPQTRFINSTVGAEIDNSRIKLTFVDFTEYLTEHRTSSIDAAHWITEVTRYLRRHGWKPFEERESDDEGSRPGSPRSTG